MHNSIIYKKYNFDSTPEITEQEKLKMPNTVLK